MRRLTTVVESDLRDKHRQMLEDPFIFLRGTFYRWAQLWPEVCDDLSRAPRLLAIGDLHVGSFGTWRDTEGRLCWGTDDFDESYPLPYTNDLVRLATSVKLLIDRGDLDDIKLKTACSAILDGYRQTLVDGGCPFVLAEDHAILERLGIEAFKPPPGFWKKLQSLPAMRRGIPADVRSTLREALPAQGLEYRVVRRRAGVGSLGQRRFVALARWNGGLIAREAKAMLPSACVWVNGRNGSERYFYEPAMTRAVRSPDPCQHVIGRWLIRRLSPDANPIEIDALPKKRDEETLVRAMGVEAANVHLGSRRAVRDVLRHLDRGKTKWLRDAAKKMATVVEREWKTFKVSDRLCW